MRKQEEIFSLLSARSIENKYSIVESLFSQYSNKTFLELAE